MPSPEQRYVLSPLTNNSLHDIKIRAVNEIGSGDFSSTLTKNIQTKAIQTVGDNQYGQLGNGTTTDNDEFQFVSSGNWIEIDIGRDTGCAINASGELYTWGNNGLGQLGIGNTTNSYTPVKVLDPVGEPNIKWKKCAVGNSATIALSEGGTIYACGYNDFLANGSTNNSQGLVKVGDSDFQDIKFVDIKANTSSAIALSEDGDIYSWPPALPDSDYPEKINLGQNKYEYITAIAATGYFNYYPVGAITNEGFGYLIRRYSYGTFHDIISDQSSGGGDLLIKKLSFSDNTVIALSDDDKVYVKGYLGEGLGSVGNWNTIQGFVYLLEASGLQASYPIVDVASTVYNNHFLDRNGTIFGIGNNLNGELAINQTGSLKTYWTPSSGTLYYDQIKSAGKNIIALGSYGTSADYATTTTTTTTTTASPQLMTQTQTGGYSWLGTGSASNKFRLTGQGVDPRMRGDSHSPYHTGWNSSNAPKWTINTAGTLNISRTGWSSADDESDHQIYKNGSLALTLQYDTTSTSTLSVAANDVIEYRGGQFGSYNSDTYIVNPEFWVS